MIHKLERRIHLRKAGLLGEPSRRVAEVGVLGVLGVLGILQSEEVNDVYDSEALAFSASSNALTRFLTEATLHS